jgi:hypothetical protein
MDRPKVVRNASESCRQKVVRLTAITLGVNKAFWYLPKDLTGFVNLSGLIGNNKEISNNLVYSPPFAEISSSLWKRIRIVTIFAQILS